MCSLVGAYMNWLTQRIEIKQKMHSTNTKNEVENQLNKKNKEN